MPFQEILIPTAGAKANPRQALSIDDLDSKREFSRLLNYLSPQKRVDFLQWVCNQALLPGSRIHPAVSLSTRKLAEEARYEDAALERLTVEVVHS